MGMIIQKAQRKQAKLRIGLSGPSGSGKTYSALLVARGLASSWEKVLLIDTENGSGELYSDLGEYNVLGLTAPYTPERYIEAIKAAEQAGMEVIIVDSVTHEWDGEGGCLQLNELLANSKYKGNTWSAWSETTPRHQRFIEAITGSSCHVITTVRNKVETVMGEDKKVKKVGTKEVQREGFEYELTANFNIDRDTHRVTASKDRTNLFDKRDPFLLDTKIGEELAAWNAGGAVDTKSLRKEVLGHYRRLSIDLPPMPDVPLFMKTSIKNLTGQEWAEENLAKIVEVLKTIDDSDMAKELAYGAPKKAATPEPEPEPAPMAEAHPNEPTSDELDAIMQS